MKQIKKILLVTILIMTFVFAGCSTTDTVKEDINPVVESDSASDNVEIVEEQVIPEISVETIDEDVEIGELI